MNRTVPTTSRQVTARCTREESARIHGPWCTPSRSAARRYGAWSSDTPMERIAWASMRAGPSPVPGRVPGTRRRRPRRADDPQARPDPSATVATINVVQPSADRSGRPASPASWEVESIAPIVAARLTGSPAGSRRTAGRGGLEPPRDPPIHRARRLKRPPAILDSARGRPPGPLAPRRRTPLVRVPLGPPSRTAHQRRAPG